MFGGLVISACDALLAQQRAVGEYERYLQQQSALYGLQDQQSYTASELRYRVEQRDAALQEKNPVLKKKKPTLRSELQLETNNWLRDVLGDKGV